jgi:glutamyl-tRNA synthetase
MPVTVRFAPSPTGRLHVGNIRAALVNWLYARKEGGTFILRLDDTDRERSTEEFAEGIKNDLKWLGLQWDTCYRQSERIEKYDAAAASLKAADRLYACYETAEELEVKRKMQLARKLPPVYDRAALQLSGEDKAELEAGGRRPHWRFRLNTPGRVEFKDLIRGPVSLDLESVSDPILVREDGSYLYSLPSVVDDLELEISHVVRGEDHVTNSAVQMQIFEALGGAAPVFAHFSLLTSPEGGGLSKRERALSIEDLREQEGIEQMAILSLLARLGTSEAVEAESVMEPLIEGFDFSKFARKPTKFDHRELDHLNARILHAMDYSAVSKRVSIEGLDEAFWNAVRPNLGRFGELEGWWTIVHGPLEPQIEDREFLSKALALLAEGEITDETWGDWTSAIKSETGRKGRDLFMPLRLALTGQAHGPEMQALLPLIGAERVRARLAGEIA